MNKLITCFIAGEASADTDRTYTTLIHSALVKEVYILQKERVFSSAKAIEMHSLEETPSLKTLAGLCQTPYLLLYTKPLFLQLSPHALERFVQVAKATTAALLYSDYYEMKENELLPHPLIDCQTGSVRDDFQFGSVLFFSTESFKEAVSRMEEEYHYSALYDLRLKIAQKGEILRIPEYLYTEQSTDSRSSGKRIFDYVDPRNREVQIEREKVFIRYLKDIQAWLPSPQTEILFEEGGFPVEASVVIPVKNRERTISEALLSAVKQQTDFEYNILVVDNHSTDRTTGIVQELAKRYPQIIPIFPEHVQGGIGGCWNRAVNDPRCGRFCIQLDSDDLYAGPDTLQRIIQTFREEKTAMVIGSYQMVNFSLEEIPPGKIDHREWTPENGHNNALRINGLGAPRAFYTPIIRKILFPDCSYGEDYAAVLAISRQYRIGRIFEPIYLCRRWEDNSDAFLTLPQENVHNFYKDRIRSIELKARQLLVQNNKYENSCRYISRPGN